MTAAFDSSEDNRGETGPFLGQTEVIGLYRPEHAAVASRGTTSSVADGDPGNIDD